jgi:hypothetical protein
VFVSTFSARARAIRYALIAALLLIVPSVALAQTRFEVTPYVGWRDGNDVRDKSGLAVQFDSGVAYGFIVDVAITRNLYAEFTFSYRDTHGRFVFPPAVDPFTPTGTFEFDGTLNYYQGGIVYHFETGQPAFRPFLFASFGAARLSTEGASSSNMSGTVGGGIKFMFSNNVGVRGEYRLFVTDTDFVGRGNWCNWWGYCYSVLTTQYLYQSQLSAGLIIGF